MLEKLLAIAIPLFFLMDYIGTVPVFLALTKNFDRRARTRAAIASPIIASAIVLLFALLGNGILHYFDLSIAGLKVGGGLLMLYIAVEMIFSGQLAYEQADKTHVIVSPLAIPMLAGPGSMAFAMIAFIQQSGSDKLLVPLAILLTCVIGIAILLASSIILKVFGKEFTRGLEKVTAVLLAVIAAEMIMSGIKMYFF